MHVRYEDTTSQPDAPFAVGVTLDRFALSSTNSRGEAMFINRVDPPSSADGGGTPRFLLHKTATVGGLGVYVACLDACRRHRLIALPWLMRCPAGTGTAYLLAPAFAPWVSTRAAAHSWTAFEGPVRRGTSTCFVRPPCTRADVATRLWC